MKHRQVVALVAVALFVASCASKERPASAPSSAGSMERTESESAYALDDDVAKTVEEETAKAVPVAALVEGNNRFALDLLKQVDPGEVAYSPYAVSMGGLLLESAAAEKTKEELRAALHLRLEEGIVAQKVGTLREGVGASNSRGFDVGAVQHLWLDRRVGVDGTWSTMVTPTFAPTIENIDLSDADAARATIDESMAAATFDAMETITAKLELGTGNAALALAAAPRGAWDLPFERAMTREAIFTDRDGTKGSRPVMRGSGRFGYYEDGSAQVVAIPYEGGATAIVILPRDGTFERVESGLSYPKFKHYLANLRSKQVDVTLPKVAIDTTIDLIPVFRSMGVAAAFGSEADFSPSMGADSGPIDLWVHQTLFSIDEDGTRAQARSVHSERSDGGVQFEATRSFLVFVRDDDTGQILIVARVT